MADPSWGKVCKCCGQTLPPDEDVRLRLSRGERDILDAVRKAGRWGIHSDRLYGLLYDADPNGGPLTGKNTLRVRINQINSKLRMTGQIIKGTQSGERLGFYKLVAWVGAKEGKSK